LVNGSQAQQDAAKAEYRRAKEAYPASHERFNEEFWAPFKPGGSHYGPGGAAADADEVVGCA
jgi:hypothetical protein